MTGLFTLTYVSDEAIAPIRMEIITSPIRVHMIPKTRAGIERGQQSPYLQGVHVTDIYKSIGIHLDTEKCTLELYT